MKKYIVFLFSIASLFCQAQEDTTIYTIVDELARFPGCEGLDTTINVKNQCAQASLLAFMYGNIVYPLAAREAGNEGQVVANFIVEKDGYVSNPKILKDIGGGCGEETVRVLNGMNEALKEVKVAWRPGMKDGKAVRSQVTLPIKFKLQDPPDFILAGRDSIYVVLDDSLQYNGGFEVFAQYIDDNLKYPTAFKDSCLIGDMDMQLLIQADGSPKILDIVDYSGLGNDFQFEAISVANSTFGNWVPATRKGRKVPSAFTFSLLFIPEEAGCQSVVQDYERANNLANAASLAYNDGDKDAAYQKLEQAINLFPNNANYLYLRGQAYMADDNMVKACEDLTRVKEIVPIGLVNDILPLVCARAAADLEATDTEQK